MAANLPLQDLGDLQRRAIALETQAAAQTRRYQRSTWMRFVAVFVPVPFVVLLLRLEIAAWTYYVWGVLLIGSAAVLYVIDSAASARTDAAVKAAEQARPLFEEARTGRSGSTPP